jgi:hypothetical protein
MFWQSCLICPVPSVLCQMSCPDCPIPAVLLSLSCPGCPWLLFSVLLKFIIRIFKKQNYLLRRSEGKSGSQVWIRGLWSGSLSKYYGLVILILSQGLISVEDASKGSVQRKLSWVNSGVNRCVGALDRGAGHAFVVFFGFHLGFTFFPFPVPTDQFTGKFGSDKWSITSDVAPIVLALISIHTWFLPPIGEAGHICSTNEEFSQILFLPDFAY